ncbi:cysteine desulfurase [Actibacterium pelagium]|uniref:Cysteine desulfurase n=2 Tax=Actibacterium pelagium TaxID=2029103 RepID=A0A917EHP0_9RHOB|nr:cysteine desulfurase [Actibacterium pelagium]
MLDTEFVRAQFPAFSQPSLADQAFFENAGGSYPCRQVVDRLTGFYTDHKVQPYYPFLSSQKVGAEMDEARARLAAMMGVTPDEVSFGPSTTQNTYVLAQAFRQWMSPGDAIVVTNQDHEANSGPWRRLADDGIEVREWSVDPETGRLDPADLEAILDEKVRLVCFPHCSNVVAEINDVAAICATAHMAGAFACVDGVSYAPHGLPNVGELGPDIYLFSAYKTYGPHQGIMVMRPALNALLPNQAHYFNADVPYKRFTPAGPDHAQVASCAGIADYFDAIYDHHFDGTTDAAEKCAKVSGLMRQKEVELAQPILTYLAERNSVRLLGPSDAKTRAPTIAVVAKTPAAELAQALAADNINAGCGTFYGNRVLQAMGEDIDHGALRLSLVHYNTNEEVDRLLNALDRLL